MTTRGTPAAVRAAPAYTSLCTRETARKFDQPDAALLSARVGHGALRIVPPSDRLIPMFEA